MFHRKTDLTAVIGPEACLNGPLKTGTMSFSPTSVDLG